MFQNHCVCLAIAIIPVRSVSYLLSDMICNLCGFYVNIGRKNSQETELCIITHALNVNHLNTGNYSF